MNFIDDSKAGNARASVLGYGNESYHPMNFAMKMVHLFSCVFLSLSL